MDNLQLVAGCCLRLRIRSIAADHPCPPRALHGEHQRSFTANHGQPKPLLKGSILPELSCSQAHNQKPVPPAGLAPGWLQDRARIVVGHQGSGYPVLRQANSLVLDSLAAEHLHVAVDWA